MKAMRAFGWTALLFSLILAACTGTTTPAPTTTAAATAATVPTAVITPTLGGEPSPTGEPVWLLQIEMVDAQTGWGMGTRLGSALQRVLRTGDGGQTWQDVTPSERVADLESIAFQVRAAFWGVERAWVMYFSPAPAQSSDAFFTYHTEDGGVTWQTGEPLDLNGLMMDFFLPGEMGFSDENNGWLLAHLGAGMNHDYVAIFKTSDAGQTWMRVVEPPQGEETQNALPMSCIKRGVTFTDAQNGWMAGNCQGVVDEVYLYRTQDGGLNWQLVELPAPAEQLALQNQQNACDVQPPVFREQTGYLSVTCTDAQGGQRWLYRSDDGGETWLALDAPATFGDLALTPGLTPLLLGWNDRSGEEPRTLYASEDGGQSWQVRMADIALWSDGLDFVDEQNGWVIVERNKALQLLRTRDGGRTWETLTPLLMQ